MSFSEHRSVRSLLSGELDSRMITRIILAVIPRPWNGQMELRGHIPIFPWIQILMFCLHPALLARPREAAARP
jgi:hypothetical protein